MSTLELQAVTSKGIFHPKTKELLYGPLTNFNYTFTFGKSYLLDSGESGAGQTLSWIIGGELEQEGGSITQNGVPYTLFERKQDAWCVRYSALKTKKFSVKESTVREQIQHGLKVTQAQYPRTEADIVKQLYLTQERCDRPLRQLSNESWRASCAIGFANGKKIFCFPYLGSGFIENYYSLWLKEMLGFLKSSGALILVPATAHKAYADLCDEVLTLK